MDILILVSFIALSFALIISYNLNLVIINQKKITNYNFSSNNNYIYKTICKNI